MKFLILLLLLSSNVTTNQPTIDNDIEYQVLQEILEEAKHSNTRERMTDWGSKIILDVDGGQREQLNKEHSRLVLKPRVSNKIK